MEEQEHVSNKGKEALTRHLLALVARHLAHELGGRARDLVVQAVGSVRGLCGLLLGLALKESRQRRVNYEI
jgi:hypothetical protein